jgi:hypothetical protein
MTARIVTRRRRDLQEIDLGIQISRGRSFSFSLPKGVPYDRDDADRIVEELEAITPPPDEIQEPVASGLGDLVCDSFVVTWWDCKRTDDDLLLEVEDAVKRSFVNRAWRVHDASGQVESRRWPREAGDTDGPASLWAAELANRTP